MYDIYSRYHKTFHNYHQQKLGRIVNHDILSKNIIMLECAKDLEIYSKMKIVYENSIATRIFSFSRYDMNHTMNVESFRI